ncbi:hypothetical protein ACLOJK_036052 [Asimina triloba]
MNTRRIPTKKGSDSTCMPEHRTSQAGRVSIRIPGLFQQPKIQNRGPSAPLFPHFKVQNFLLLRSVTHGEDMRRSPRPAAGQPRSIQRHVLEGGREPDFSAKASWNSHHCFLLCFRSVNLRLLRNFLFGIRDSISFLADLCFCLFQIMFSIGAAPMRRSTSFLPKTSFALPLMDSTVPAPPHSSFFCPSFL